jgi:hypothetical protein
MERVWVNASKQASYSNDRCSSLMAPSCEQGDDMTVPWTPTPMMNKVWSSSPWTEPIAEPTPIGFAPTSLSYPPVCGGLKNPASVWEQGIWTKYAPSIPDAFVGDIISLFGSNDNDDDILKKTSTRDEWDHALSLFPSSFDNRSYFTKGG